MCNDSREVVIEKGSRRSGKQGSEVSGGGKQMSLVCLPLCPLPNGERGLFYADFLSYIDEITLDAIQLA